MYKHSKGDNPLPALPVSSPVKDRPPEKTYKQPTAIEKVAIAAIEQQLDRWGVVSLSPEWRHLRNGAMVSLSVCIPRGKHMLESRVLGKPLLDGFEDDKCVQEKCPEILAALGDNWATTKNINIDPPILGVSIGEKLSEILGRVLQRVGAQAVIDVIDAEQNINTEQKMRQGRAR